MGNIFSFCCYDEDEYTRFNDDQLSYSDNEKFCNFSNENDNNNELKPLDKLPNRDGHYIYIMRNQFYKDDVIKIGRTNNLVRRVKELNN